MLTNCLHPRLDLLNPETPIIVTATPTPLLPIQYYTTTYAELSSTDPIRSYGDSLFTDLWDSQRIDFGFLETQRKSKTLDDPLPDSVFEPAHKKAERLERSIRNSEKARAQHEKDQIIRLLNGLQGHDWLRTMGVSGITESRKKTFEPAREHFIKGCQSILDKFRRWAAEEKHRKQQKDHAIAEAKAEALRQTPQHDGAKAGEEGEEAAEQTKDEVSVQREVQDSEEEESEDDAIDVDPPDDSDVEASIAKQLRDEALAAAKKKTRRGRHATPQLAPPPASEKAPAKEMTSFFQKKYQRDAALSKSRRKGRKVLAFGQPIPDLDERDFELPEDVMDAELMKAHERKTRLRKRARNQR